MDVTTAFMDRIRDMYPSRSSTDSVLDRPWYILAAVAFSASNVPEAIPRIFHHVLEQLPKESPLEERRLLARKVREALFKSGLISGYPKAINSLRALHESMPEELKETEVLRQTSKSLSEFQAQGKEHWDSVYGETAGSIQQLLRNVYPDLEWFSIAIGYGVVYSSRPDILSPLETSFSLVAALIAGDTPQQIVWHLKGAHRCGASVEEVQAARNIAIEVAKHSGVTWKHPVPEIDL
ncbi:AhpD-like protein [Coprinopsis sp. MPI-PUGE-AT-0042]|nr:AhpD-like protein [Coprinopsis sp. MPI-PUGE-AT-0042]